MISIKLLISQFIVLLVWYLGMYPNTLLANLMEKLFGDYTKALTYTMGIQILGLVTTLLYIIWTA